MGACIDDNALAIHPRVVIEDVTFERAMSNAVFEIILLHLAICAVGCPFVVRHAIERRHCARSMATAPAMNIDWLIRRVVDQPQKQRALLGRRRFFIAHRDAIKFHPSRFDRLLLVGFAFALKVNYGLYAQIGEVSIIIRFRLSASVKVFVDASEILDANL
jgi:hypothetical protein